MSIEQEVPLFATPCSKHKTPSFAYISYMEANCLVQQGIQASLMGPGNTRAHGILIATLGLG